MVFDKSTHRTPLLISYSLHSRESRPDQRTYCERFAPHRGVAALYRALQEGRGGVGSPGNDARSERCEEGNSRTQRLRRSQQQQRLTIVQTSLPVT